MLYNNVGLRKLFSKIFKAFVQKAKLVFCTESIYLEQLSNVNQNVHVIFERFLKQDKEKEKTSPILKTKTLNLITIGTISENKNPIKFIEFFNKISGQNKVSYTIIGKTQDAETQQAIRRLTKDNSSITFIDDYRRKDQAT